MISATRRCTLPVAGLIVVIVGVLVLAADVASAQTGEVAQESSPATAQPPDDEFDVEGDLLDVDLEEVEQVEHVYDIHSLIEQDGSYLWQDGDRQIVMRLLDSLSEDEQAELGRLAENAARSYVPPLHSNDTRSLQQPLTTSHWFESDTGQRYLLAGGVNAVFESHVSEETAAAIVARHGIAAQHMSPWGELSNAYHIATSSDAETMRLVAALSAEADIDSVAPNWSSPFEVSPTSLATGAGTGTGTGSLACAAYTKVLGISDELAGCMWNFDSSTDYRSHLQTPPVDPVIDINIGDVWSTTKGEGVVVAIVDKPVEVTHPDLVDNLDLSRFSNWGDPNPHPLSYRHGTAVAGVVGARDNTIGGRGVAPRATMINFNLLNNFSARYSVEAMSLHRDVVAVSNHSYSARGFSLTRTSDNWKRAVTEGITVGYGGKGQTYVASAGNDRSWTGEGWATHNESKNHRGIITVCGVTAYGEAASYSEAGPSLWVCAPTRDVSPELPGVLTMALGGSYTDSFGGTSAAAPQVAGVAALMRSANPALTWRDVKVILANTAQHNHPGSDSWLDGALQYGSQSDRYRYSYRYGFGVVDAEAAVTASTTWTPLPPMVTTESAETILNAELSGVGGHEEVYSLEIDSEIDFIEHIDVIVDLDTGFVREYRIDLISPSGTETLLSEPSDYCSLSCPLKGSFHFGTARHLGESATGTWQLKIRSMLDHNKKEPCDSDSSLMCPTSRGQFNSWKIAIHGHESVADQTRRISLTASESHIAEGADVTLTASTDGAPLATDLTVPIVVTPDTASASDYVAPSSIVIPAGDTSASATLSALDDVLSEIDETVALEIGELPPGHVAVGGSVVATIIDDEPDPAVRLVVSDTDVTEGGSVTITAELSSPVPVKTKIALSLERLPLAAKADAKLRMPSGGARILTIPPGAVHSSESATFTTTQNDDREYATGPRRAFRILGDTHGSHVADPEAVKVVIVDDDVALQPCESLPDAVTETQAAAWRDESTDADHVLRFNRVLAALGTRDDVAPMTIAESRVNEDLHTYGRWLAVTRTLNSFAQCSTGHLMTPPTVSVTAGPDVIEGDVFRFTVSAAPALTLPLPVKIDIATTGEFLVWSEPQLVTIPAGGAFDLKLSSGNDYHDEPDGTVTATVSAGADYTVGAADSATLTIHDDDELLPQIEIAGAATVSEGEGLSVTMTASPAPLSPLDVVVDMSHFGQGTATSWAQTVTMPTSGSVTFTVATPDNSVDEPDSLLLVEVAYSLEYLLSYHSRVLVVTVRDDDDPSTPIIDDGSVEPPPVEPPPAEPEISISAGADVSEGGDATFTVTATPTPAADLDVAVTISQSGDYAASGSRTVTIPTTGSATLTVSTTNDSTDEPDGSVTATVDSGTGYTVSTSNGAATVSVSDDDDPPPPTPEISIVAGAGVSEGGHATFTITASPAPHAALSVDVSVAQDGDYGASVGARTVSIPTSGTYTLTVATSDDSTDEPDGSVTATLDAGTGYTVSATASTATVAVSDDDDPPPPTPEISIVAGAGVSEGGHATFTVTASPAPLAVLSVDVSVAQDGDYGAPTGTRTVTIPTSGTYTLTVATSDDSTDEPDGSVTATLDAGTGYTVSATASTATVAVSDDDDPAPSGPPTLSVSDATATEGDPQGLRFVVTLSRASTQTITLGYGVFDRSASMGQDFTAPYQEFTLEPGDTRLEIVVPVIDDTETEGDETLTLFLFAQSGITIPSYFLYATGTIEDND